MVKKFFPSFFLRKGSWHFRFWALLFILVLSSCLGLLTKILFFSKTARSIIPTPCKICDAYFNCVNTQNPSCSSLENECSVSPDCLPFTPTPTPKPNGVICNLNSDCQSGYCDGPKGVCWPAPSPTLISRISSTPSPPPPNPNPYCSSDTIQACNYSSTALISLKCEQDLSGGHCVTQTSTTADCLANCLANGNTPSECNASCPGILGSYCSGLKTYQCSEYYLNYKCEPDVSGGHCVPDSFLLKQTGEGCQLDGECTSGRCDYLPIHNASVCVPSNICTPGEVISKNPNLPLSCSLKCSTTGTSWITQWDDCTPYTENYTQYCDGNVLKIQTVVYENGLPQVREQNTNCPGGCSRGLCVAQANQSCAVGDYSYVQGSCRGISGCPATLPDQNYDGNCLARCNSSQWEITPACGNISIDEDFTDSQSYAILRAASNFGPGVLEGAGFHFIRESGYYLESTWLIDLVSQLLNSYTSEQSATLCAGTNTVSLIAARIQIAECGLDEATYAHELVHYIASQDSVLLGSYSIAIGCEGNVFSSEGYQYNNEEPVSGYGRTNCEEAMAEAAAEYQVNPCEMQANYPIQYEWMRDHLYGGEEFCNQTSLLPSTPVSKKIAGASISQSSDFLKNLKSPEVLATTTPKTHIGQFTIGSTQSQVVAELGPASETSQQFGLNVLSYNTNDSLRPNVFIFDSTSKLVYFRVGKDRILDTFKTIEPWMTNFKNPEGIVSSSTAYLSTRLIYPRAGFSFVALNDTGEVIQYEAFTPIYLDEYLDSWGKELLEEEVGYPTTHKKGDINRDFVVNNDDYSLFLPEFGKKGFSVSDIDWDRVVDGVDYVIWLNNTSH